MEDGAVTSWISLGEVLYVEARRQGVDPAIEIIDHLAEQLVGVEEAGPQIVRKAAAVKAWRKVSLADSFAIATAEHHGVPLLTGDPEILSVERSGLEIIDLRQLTTG